MINSRITAPVLVTLASLAAPAPAFASTIDHAAAASHAVQESAATRDSTSAPEPHAAHGSASSRKSHAAPGSSADLPPESVLVTGTGQVSGTPDTMTADFAVEGNAATVDQAVTIANAAAAKMRDTLVHSGIARADLQTSNLSIGTKVNNDQVITGYTVSEGLTAKIHDLPHAGQLLSTAITAGGDAARLNGVTFSIDNNATLLSQARKKAFADAHQKADLYAHEAGRPLDRVLQINETTPTDGGPIFHFSAPAAMNAKFPIEPGRQQLTVNVTVEWAFGPATQPAQSATHPATSHQAASHATASHPAAVDLTAPHAAAARPATTDLAATRSTAVHPATGH